MNEFSLSQATWLVLRKQHLTPEAAGNDVVEVARDVAGLHATAATTPYLSLLARCPRFTRADLEDALYTNHRLVRIRCVRKTLYILPVELVPAALAATRAIVQGESQRYMAYRGVSPAAYERLAADILALLPGKEMAAAEIRKAVGSDADVPAVLNLMCDLGSLVRTRPAAGWRDASHRYARFDEYLPGVRLDEMDERTGVLALVRGYLNAFGPATEGDVAWWTGLGKTAVREALADLGAEVARVTVAGLAADCILLRSALPDLEGTAPGAPAPVSLLPILDPYLMGYRERGRYLDPRQRELVFDRSGNATSVILVAGRVSGVWDYAEVPEPTLKLHLFAELPTDVRQAIWAAAGRVGAFMAEGQTQIRECTSMIPLTQRPAGAVKSPLRDCAI